MSGQDMSFESLGFSEKEARRIRIIEEAEEMRQTAISTGSERHLPAIDNIETQALDALEEIE